MNINTISAPKSKTAMKETKKTAGKKFRFADILVVLFCLSGAAYSVNLFWNDLYQTISGQNNPSIGTVTIKKNTVQRRMTDRIIWDRLIKESPVYSHDLIRVAENSEADLNVGGNLLALSENTLVRLWFEKDTGEYQIELTTGNMGLVTSAEGESVIVNIMGREVEAAPGTTLNAAVGDKGMELQISEGAVTVKEDNKSRELSAGTMIAFDTQGSVRSEPALVVIQPRLNARYRKIGNKPLNVGFLWNRINLPPDQTLRLEIAEDQAFTRSVRTLDGLDTAAQTALEAGMWNWRIMHNGAVLSSGRITIMDGEPKLLSPARNQEFFYETELPKLFFQWSAVEDVSHYIIEVDVTPEFRNPIIKKQSAAASFADSSLDAGIWYWRVLPVFSQTNEAHAGSISADLNTAAFRIVKGEEPQTPLLPVVAVEEPPEPEPQPVVEAPPPPPPPEPVIRPPRRITLESPSQGAALPGLTALRQQTVFRWTSNEAVARSRFVLSRNSNPLRGPPAVEIIDPNRTIRLDRLGEGIWYWTVEAQTPAGIDISAPTPRRLQVLPIPLLPAPANRQPAPGQHIGIEEIKQVNIDFRWSAVPGANAYIFTLFQEAGNERRQIIQIGPENRTSWTTDIKTLGRGSFIWAIEAVNMGRNNVIEQRGRRGEYSFVIDIPRPGPIRILNE
ncbi:MAG: hypothetical protein LBH43_03770 [Treponema sp.]|nr:hypothetical protein [Treponema sp.]